MDQQLPDFIRSCLTASYSFIKPYLDNYSLFSQSLTKQIKVKKGNNVQFDFDLKLDEVIKKQIERYQINGRFFSEESGFFELGANQYRVVYDPFCNSSLAALTFRDAALGISVFSWEYELLASAILDYQTGLAAIKMFDECSFHQLPGWNQVEINRVKTTDLDKAWVVLTLEKKKEREHLLKAQQILQQSERITVGSGHIYWLRLAAGFVDGYLDPFGGEKLYEMFAASIAQCAGCKVTDLAGNVFRPGEMLKIFENNSDFTYFPVAATNHLLQESLLSGLDV